MVIIYTVLTPIVCSLIFTGVVWTVFYPDAHKLKAAAILVDLMLILLATVMENFILAVIAALILYFLQRSTKIRTTKNGKKDKHEDTHCVG